jgi:two-component system, chemotaxis family, protein-glutamate methylesterase/glutaminase
MGGRHIIAIGGSTGALSAMRRLCADLPANLDAAVFVTLHVGREGQNLIASILDKAGPLPVSTAADGEQVERGHIYVAPADRHLIVIDDVIRLGRGPRENMARPAVDPLLRSVGVSYGPRAIGAVLSGMLNDGAAGLSDLRRCGGLTVVQNPGDAEAPDMPLSALQACDVDHRAPIGDMAELLAALLNEPAGLPPAVPAEIALEVDIALGRPCLTETIAQFADPVALTCPDCSGVLSQVRRGPPLRYRCQVGHAYTAENMAKHQSDTLGEAIRIALRIVEERAVLAEKMAQDARLQGRDRSGNAFEAKAKELRQQADVLRASALGSAEGVRTVRSA